MVDNNEENEDRKEFDETVKGLREMGKEFLGTITEITKEISGEKFVESIKKGSADVQVKFEETLEKVSDLKDDLNEKVSVYKTDKASETLMPVTTDESYVVAIVLAGLSKKAKKIDLSIEDGLLVINIDSEGIDSNIKKHWSVSKDRLVFDLTGVDDYDEKTIKAVHKDGVFTVTVPRIEREVVKTEISID